MYPKLISQVHPLHTVLTLAIQLVLSNDLVTVSTYFTSKSHSGSTIWIEHFDMRVIHRPLKEIFNSKVKPNQIVIPGWIIIILSIQFKISSLPVMSVLNFVLDQLIVTSSDGNYPHSHYFGRLIRRHNSLQLVNEIDAVTQVPSLINFGFCLFELIICSKWARELDVYSKEELRFSDS